MGVIFKLFMKFIVGIANFFLAPVNILLVNVFPDFTDRINQFEALIGRYVTPLFSWFFQLVPPNARNLIGIYIALLVIIYTVSLGIHAIVKVIHLINNIKIW